MTTNVPAIQFTTAGIVVPEESAILTGVQEDINAAFGGNLNFTNLNTPQGQLASSWAAVIADAYASFAEIANQMNPDTNTGFMQDAIARIYFLNRNPGVPTTVQCTCVGLFGTVIAVGAQAQDTSGNLYVCTAAVTIPVGGSVTASFANQGNGPIACPANTLTKIYQQVPGWDSINNPSDGVEGALVESPAAFEYRREQSVALNGHGSLPSIQAAVFDVAGVIDCYATENVTDSTIHVGSTSYALLPHSLYVGVSGGAAQSIANAIWLKKDVGCNMNGNTTETVEDTGNYAPPYPTYSITFNTLTPTPIYFTVKLANSADLPSNIATLVQAAIIAQFTGANGGARARAGALLLASPFYGPVQQIGNYVSILFIGIGSTFAGDCTVVNASNVLTVTTATSGLLSPGTVLTATGVAAGATIVQQLSGTTGGVGTYQMSANATATEGSPVALAGAPGTSQLIGIDQEPTIVAADITVTLV